MVYSPTLSVAGLKNMASATELREMLVGAMPAAASQLTIDKPFVLRHLARGYGPEVLHKSTVESTARVPARACVRVLAWPLRGGGLCVAPLRPSRVPCARSVAL